jgi:Ca2+-binding RTX toxin-like protein
VAGVALNASRLRVGAGVTTANTLSQRFLFNTTNGNLYFDADGSGVGAAVQIATLAGVGSLSTTAFQVV